MPSRLCEKTVRDTIMKHMNDNNLFSTCQYGFRNKRSCILQLLDVLDDWTKYYDENKQIKVKKLRGRQCLPRHKESL